jgi:hypothetical protein
VARQLQIPWYNAFVNCTLPHTEAPKNFLFWSAISVLGGILKNNVYFKDGLYTLYPNQFIILTGPPGIGKGTAINFAWKLIKTQTNPLANVLNDEITGPKLLHTIADGWDSPPRLVNGNTVLSTKDHTCTIIATELQSLLDSGEGMIVRLNKLWEQDTYEYKTKNQGNALVKGMCVNIIGGTVPDYVRGLDANYGSVVGGGLSARCIFILEDKKSKEMPYIPAIEASPASADLYAKLKLDLHYISQNVKGEYAINDEARIVFSNFYPATSPLPEDSDAMLNFKGRMRTHIWKMAMILSAARKDKMVIEAPDVKDAIFLVTTVRRQLDKVFRGIGTSQLAEPTARVQQTIERFGMVTKNELISAVHRHVDPQTLDRVLYVLETIGYCMQKKVGTKVYYMQIPKVVQGVGLGASAKSVRMP